MRPRLFRGVTLAAVMAASPVLAQTTTPEQPAVQHEAGGMMAGMSANHKEMMAAMEKMNRAMMGAAMTGDADRDLVTMMMPHHQGAIDMARIYLRDGKDPTIRAMAEKIITDQEREIAEFNAWLAKHPAPPP